MTWQLVFMRQDSQPPYADPSEAEPLPVLIWNHFCFSPAAAAETVVVEQVKVDAADAPPLPSSRKDEL